MSKIILIVGPTGTGKTTLSIKLAKKYDAVILNADSTQVYTEPLIATAKIKEHEKENIEHYLFDVVSLNDDYTLYDYQKDGRRLLDRFISENKNVIIVGGSGLYVKALLYNYVLEDKKEIDIDFSEYSNEELKNKVLALDPQSDIHVNNRQRLESFLKHYYETGKVIKKTDEINNKLYNFISIGLKSDRERYLKHAIGIEIKPKDNSYKNASILNYPGQRQAICYNLYSRLGVLRESNEPVFTPIPRKDQNTQAIYLAFMPMIKDEKKVIDAVKSAPILASAKGKYLALKNLTISGKENE